MDSYNSETITKNGRDYRIEWFYDTDMGAPWKEYDGHGIVSDWENRDKLPGEMILADDGRGRARNGMRRFYDFAASIQIAKRDGWNTAPYTWKTKGEQAHAATMADYEYLRRYCNDDWHYCGIVVTRLDEEGEESAYSSSLWGIEDDYKTGNEYHAEVIADLIAQIEQEEEAATFPVSCCGV